MRWSNYLYGRKFPKAKSLLQIKNMVNVELQKMEQTFWVLFWAIFFKLSFM